jgi:tight adherence protein B
MSVQLPGKPSTPYNPLIPSALLRNGVGVLALALVVGLLFFLAVSRLRAVPESERRKQRVRDHTERTPGSEAQERATLAGLIASLNTRLRGLPRFERIERLVETAAVPASAATIVAASVVLAFVLSLFVAVLTTSAFLTIVFFLLGLAGPILFLRMLARRRVRAFEDQLPDVLAAIASSLRVGHGLKQSLQAVASEGAPPMSIELRRVLAEARLGRPLEEALVAMCERLGSDDLIYVATAVDVQSQVGGSLAGVFETVSETVRERQQHRRRVRALTATGRATAIVMSVMPFAFLFFLLLIAPHYVTPFLTSHIGRVLMVLSVLSIGIGAFLLNRIVSVKT